MLNLLFRLLLTFNSLVVFLVMFAVKAHMWIPKLGVYTLFLYILLPVLMSLTCIKLAHYLGHDSIEKVENIELGAESYMSVYLGYFFVAVGIPDNDIMLLLFAFIILFLFILFSQAQYFNPLFLVLGYRFYGITKANGISIFIISRKKLHGVCGLSFTNLRRINDFTYIDEEK